ncbi:MAG: hypothetical protein NTV32_03475 [Gammaproteobacteria bacterium]|nr:hypothetical protein [Gammaproteobacteria bacterium]
MKLRQLTIKNDPRLSAKLPSPLLEQVRAAAKSGKRPIPDEVIRRIGRTFRDIYAVEYRVEACELKGILKNSPLEEKHMQRFPKEMLEALEESANHEGHSLDMEVTLRLMATFHTPHIFEAGDLFTTIRHTRLTKADEDRERQQYKIACASCYERDKLKVFLAYADRLPKTTREVFHYIDVDSEAEIILQKMRKQDLKNKAPKDPIKKRDWHAIKKMIQVIPLENKPDPEDSSNQ